MTDFRTRIAVLDYGMGNLHSASKALEHVAPHADVVVTSNIDDIANADRVVFPGVGAIRDCMAEIKRLGFDAAVQKAITEKPVLAICVGMQALMESSEENNGVDCMGVLPGRVRFFGKNVRDAQGEKLKVPHMGWNQVNQTIDHPIWQGIEQNSRFYFVHSYYVEVDQADSGSDETGTNETESTELIAASCDYGLTFPVALAKGNLFAVQFHPEKSHTSGLKLLENFVEWQPA